MVYKPEKKVKIGYVTILEKSENNIWDKLKNIYKYFLNKIDIENAGNNIILKIPMRLYKKNNSKKIRKIINKINNEISNSEIDSIVLSEEVKQIVYKYKQENENEIFLFLKPILDGKFLMKNLAVDILNKILEYQNVFISTTPIYLLVEKYNKENNDIICALSKEVKNINIVTNNISNFKKLEDKLFTNTGTAISVANNKKKSLRRAEIIINLDFSNEMISKYNINRSAIIINCNNTDINLEIGFEGVIINKVQYEEKQEALEYFRIYDLIKKFEVSELYESLIFNKSYDKIQKLKREYNFKIKEFIGNRGVISIEELKVKILKNNSNNLTKV